MQNINYAFLLSRPVWGAWIEIGLKTNPKKLLRSRPVWGAWIEICKCVDQPLLSRARPVWGAWIEIPDYQDGQHTEQVAPRMGRVD